MATIADRPTDRPTARGQGPRRSRALGRGPHHRRLKPVRDRHAGETHHPLCDAGAPARRPRRRGSSRRPRGDHDDTTGAPARVADLGGQRAEMATHHDRDRIYRSLSATRPVTDSAVRTRIPTGGCGNTSRRAPTSRLWPGRPGTRRAGTPRPPRKTLDWETPSRASARSACRLCIPWIRTRRETTSSLTTRTTAKARISARKPVPACGEGFDREATPGEVSR